MSADHRPAHDPAGAARYPVLRSREVFSNKLFTLMSAEVGMPGGGIAQRDFLHHVGAVAAVAVDFPAGLPGGRVLLIDQYRPAVRARMWELPAGLTDVAGESPLAAARRELAEESDLTAESWDLMLDLHTTPGCSDELIRVYLARGIGAVPDGRRYRREAEEADLRTEWVPLDEAARMVTAGAITNATCAAGVLAAVRARDADWAGLRPAAD